MKKHFTKIVIAILLVSMMLVSVACDGGSTGDAVKLVNIGLTNEEYAFVCKKGNTELVDSVNAFMTEIKENGTFDEIVAKYFNGVGEKVGYDITTSDVSNTDANLVVATNCPFEPFEYIGYDGKAYGLDIEIAAAYAAAHGLELVIKQMPFDDIFVQVDVGYADIGMAGITVSEDRLDLYDFTEPYYQASQKLIVAADNTDFDSCTTVDEVNAKLAELSGKKIGYQNGTTGSMYINGDDDWGYAGFANITGKGYQSAQEALMDLMNGNLYAVIVDEAPANALVNAVNG